MRTVFEAANAVEAHMLVDLLKQEGIEAHILGEALQGAVGGLPANGLVRLTVADESFQTARSIIERWESNQVEPAPRPQRSSQSSGWGGLVVGLLLGISGTYLAYRTPVTTHGVDRNGDGTFDEQVTYSPNGAPVKLEVDRNLDKKTDYIANYSAQGQVDIAYADENFDGVFESKQRHKNGNPEEVESDTDGDGLPDLRWRYVNGVASTTEYIDRTTTKPVRVEHYAVGLMLFADVDTDGDGQLDTRIKYTKLAEEASRTPLPR